jgi:hypothetical protein
MRRREPPRRRFGQKYKVYRTYERRLSVIPFVIQSSVGFVVATCSPEAKQLANLGIDIGCSSGHGETSPNDWCEGRDNERHEILRGVN